MLSLALACGVAASDALDEQSEPSSMVVVTASDEEVTLRQPPAVGDSELVLVVDDDAEGSPAGASVQASAEGSLTVVANTSQPSKPLAAIVVDQNVEPASASRRVASRSAARSGWGEVFSAGPRRPAATAGIQAGQRSAATPQSSGGVRRQPAPPARRPAQIERPSAATSQYSPATQSSQVQMASSPGTNRTAQANSDQAVAARLDETAEQLLVRAYELSLIADSEAAYSQIVRWCAESMRRGVRGETQKFASELSAWALNRRGQARADQGQRDLAISDYRAAIEFDPRCWRALHNRSVALAQNGQFADAFDDVCKVVEINPEFAKAYSNRATLYVQAGDFKRALADYESALKVDGQLLPALVGHGRVCHMAGRLEDALASFNAAIDQDGEQAEIICSRGDLLVDLGRYKEALEDYARAIDLNPRFEHAYRNGAWLLATCPDEGVRDAEGALKGAEAALKCGYGERHAALDTLAAALANAGRYDEAVGMIGQALEVAPPEARPAYEARQRLYKARQPFRTHPMEEVQTAEFIQG
jgi:tetratricopeptide (TPR) repeat protein